MDPPTPYLQPGVDSHHMSVRERCRSFRPLDVLALLSTLFLVACGGAGPSTSNATAGLAGSLSSADAAFLDQTVRPKIVANGWKQFQAAPVSEIIDPTTNRGVVVLFRYSAVTADGIARGFLTVRGDNDAERGTLDLGSIQNPPGGSPQATYDLSSAWRDNLQKVATDFVEKQQLKNGQASFLVAIGAGAQNDPTALASFRIQGQTDAGLRDYFVTVLVHNQQGTIAAATSVAIGPQITPPASS